MIITQPTALDARVKSVHYESERAEPAPSSARAFLRATIPHRGRALSKIFVSHSSRDSFEAIGLVDWLAEAGSSEAFVDIDPERGIPAGGVLGAQAARGFAALRAGDLPRFPQLARVRLADSVAQ